MNKPIIYYNIDDNVEKGSLYLYIVSKNYWDENGCVDDEHITYNPEYKDLIENPIFKDFYEEAESLFSVPDYIKSKKILKEYLKSIPYLVYNKEV